MLELLRDSYIRRKISRWRREIMMVITILCHDAVLETERYPSPKPYLLFPSTNVTNSSVSGGLSIKIIFNIHEDFLLARSLHSPSGTLHVILMYGPAFAALGLVFGTSYSDFSLLKSKLYWLKQRRQSVNSLIYHNQRRNEISRLVR